MNQLRETVLGAYFSPLPCNRTLQVTFDRERIPRYKANPTCTRGGGKVYYDVAAVEKMLRARTLPCRIPTAANAKRCRRAA